PWRAARGRRRWRARAPRARAGEGESPDAGLHRTDRRPFVTAVDASGLMPDVSAITADGTRARLPDRSGIATASDGVHIAWDEFGAGDPTILLLPSAPIVHSRQWKGQVPYLSRSWRVVTYDGRGNGRSDRPTNPDAYTDDLYVADVELVMDATGTASAVLVGLCMDGVWRA